MINVNLLPPKHVFSQKEREIRKKILVFIMCLSFVFMVAFGLIFGGNFYLDGKFQEFDERQKSLQAQLSEFSQLGWDVRSIGDKVAAIKIIKGKQRPLSPVIADVQSLAGGVIAVSQLDVTSSYKLEVSGRAKDREDLDEFLQKLAEVEGVDGFLQAVTVQNLQQQESGAFSLSFIGNYVLRDQK